MYANSGYSETMFNTQQLRDTSRKLAKFMPEVMDATGAEAVVVRGKSGIALAFAMNAVGDKDIPIVVCRKPGERAHGSAIEGPDLLLSGLKYLILDDFVSSGATVKSIVADLPDAECVGIVEYNKSYGRPLDRESTGDDHVHTFRLHSIEAALAAFYRQKPRYTSPDFAAATIFA